MGTVLVDSCPRCQGAIFLDGMNEVVCLICGNRDFHRLNILLKVRAYAQKSLNNKRKREKVA